MGLLSSSLWGILFPLQLLLCGIYYKSQVQRPMVLWLGAYGGRGVASGEDVHARFIDDNVERNRYFKNTTRNVFDSSKFITSTPRSSGITTSPCTTLSCMANMVTYNP